uniref:EXS domain-containing protein n=1 Tax=Caenorhabditis japonica TaxID=281687 RepID=A0A8R1EU47_CAEJA
MDWGLIDPRAPKRSEIPTRRDDLRKQVRRFEVFRRFIWNYFRLENEHVNNCGQFRAVRDISVKPIRKGDLESLLSKMDQMDGVTHRGHDLMERVKKQKKSAKASRQLLRKNRFNRMIAAAPVVTTTFIDTTNTNS